MGYAGHETKYTGSSRSPLSYRRSPSYATMHRRRGARYVRRIQHSYRRQLLIKGLEGVSVRGNIDKCVDQRVGIVNDLR